MSPAANWGVRAVWERQVDRQPCFNGALRIPLHRRLFPLARSAAKVQKKTGPAKQVDVEDRSRVLVLLVVSEIDLQGPRCFDLSRSGNLKFLQRRTSWVWGTSKGPSTR